MNILKQRKRKKFGYKLVIEVETREDERSLRATLDYMIAKNGKEYFSKKGYLLPLASILRSVLEEEG